MEYMDSEQIRAQYAEMETMARRLQARKIETMQQHPGVTQLYTAPTPELQDLGKSDPDSLCVVSGGDRELAAFSFFSSLS